MNYKSSNSKAKTLTIVKKVITYIVMVMIAIVMMFPFYWSLLSSFRPATEIISPKLNLLPNFTTMTGAHYKSFFDYCAQYTSLVRIFLNTFFIIAMIIFFQLLFCACGAYSLSRLEYKGKKIIMKIFYLSMMMPGIICLIPQFLVVLTLGIGSNIWGVIVPGMFSIYGCLFMRSFFLSTPGEIAEAARIDGAGELRIFAQLYIPMVMAGLVTLALFTFNSNWNSYLWPSLILTDREQWVLAIAIKEFNSRAENYGPMMAAAVITIIPSVIVFLVGQRYFMDNLTFAGIK